VLRALERHYARELVVIGVHSAKFPTERQGPGLRLALRRLRISHPVVNDPTFRLWRAYAVRAWPTLIFIDPEGRVIGRHEGEIPQPVLDRLLAEMVREFSARGLLRPEPLPWQQAQEERLGGLMAFPGKVLADAAADRLYIADTGHHRIIIARLDGQVLQIVGQGEPGWLDGPAATCRFQSPEGLALGEGGLFIADEVQPGFGRTGAHMWGFQRHSVVPDLVTLGKPMGNGFPIGAVVGRRAPMDRFGSTARYSNTFAGNTVGVATADAVLTILQRYKIPQNALAMGRRLRAGVNALAKRHQAIRAVRNAGLFFGIDMGLDTARPEERRALALDVVNTMRDDGVLISTTGANEDTLKVRPPLVCQAEHVDLFLASFERTLDRLAV